MTKRLDYNQIAPAGAKALGGVYSYVLQSSLPAELIDLVYLRVSQINNCAYCLDMHTRDLLKNSVRVFLFGAIKGIRQNLKFDAELLYVAALFHDLGLADAYHTQTKRFEVDGADAAREFLQSHGIPDPKADLVWEAIALHT